MIEINGQLRNAPYYLRDTGEPPVERNPVGSKISTGLRSFFVKQAPASPLDVFSIISFRFRLVYTPVARHVRNSPSAPTNDLDFESRMNDSNVSRRY